MNRSAKVLATLLRRLKSQIYPGNSGVAVEKWCIEQLRTQHGHLSLQGYNNFPSQICINRNAVAAHGIPDSAPFVSGDLITVDIVIDVMGWKADLAWTYPVEPLDELARTVLNTAWQSSLLPLLHCQSADIGRDTADMLHHLLINTNCCLCRGFAGHRIHREIHAQPSVYYEKGACRIPRPQEPAVYCWEPIITSGSGSVELHKNGISYSTSDQCPCAQFEHMYAISSAGCAILNLDLCDIYTASNRLIATQPW